MQQLKKLLLILPTLLISLVLSSCKSSEPSLLATTEYTIIEYDQELRFPFKEKMEPVNLSIKEIIEIENVIKEKVLKIVALNTKQIDSYKSDSRNKTGFKSSYLFRRQYISGVNKNGEKVVWINFFCGDRHANSNWKNSMVIVSDGGSCYFNLKVNLNTKEIYDIGINGVARNRCITTAMAHCV